MKLAILTRCWENEKLCMGMLNVPGVDHPPIYTLENPWLGNKPFLSRIPEGTYLCSPHSGTRYKDAYKINHVAGRDAILIHAGNTVHHTKGCILPGLGTAQFPSGHGVTSSQSAMAQLRGIFGLSNFELIILPVWPGPLPIRP